MKSLSLLLFAISANKPTLFTNIMIPIGGPSTGYSLRFLLRRTRISHLAYHSVPVYHHYGFSEIPMLAIGLQFYLTIDNRAALSATAFYSLSSKISELLGVGGLFLTYAERRLLSSL